MDAGPDDGSEVLRDEAALLLTDEAEAYLHHLVDDEPGHDTVRSHLQVLQTARERGVDAAYADHRARLSGEAVALALQRWVQASDLDELRAVLAAEPALLLSADAGARMEQLLASDPGSPRLLTAAGLLALCRTDGADAFDDAAGDDCDSHHGSLVEGGPQMRDPRVLARSRLRTGQRPADGDAAFAHSLVALMADLPAEAEGALVRCADLLPSWERRRAARRLTAAAQRRPDLDAGLAVLRSLLAR